VTVNPYTTGLHDMGNMALGPGRQATPWKAAQNKTRQDQGTDRRDGRHHDFKTAYAGDQKKIRHLLQQDNCQKDSAHIACRTKSQNRYT